MTRLYCDGPTLIRAVASAVANLEQHVDEVDALNVFPVPDGDTGSNMLATMRAALHEAEQLPEDQRDLRGVADALSRGALTGARGNSGVILSQIIAGMTDGADGRRRASGLDLAQGLRRGSEVAYGSVLTPVEGTILTVIRDAADAAEAAAGRQPHVEAVLADTIEAAARSVERTPSLLPVLEDAGVVDSGGQGLYRVLEGMLQVGLPAAPGRSSPRLDGAPVLASRTEDDRQAGHGRVAHSSPTDHAAGTEHGYETQYLLTSLSGLIDVPSLRAAIETVGDSVVVAGDERRSRVHVHGERPDLAIAAGLPYGRLSQVEILDLDDQVAEHLGSTTVSREPESPKIAVVAASAAPGVADVLASLGAHVVRPGDGTRPSVGEIAAAIEASGAAEAIVLPNDRDAVLAAGLAVSLTSNVKVRIIPTRNAAEGIAAALAFDPDVRIDENVKRMETESSAVRSFTVITAAKDALVDGQQVEHGDILALDAGRGLLASGDDVVATAMAALAQLGEFELVTVYRGGRDDSARGEALSGHIAEAGWGAEVEIVDGGLPHDHLLVAVE